VERRGKGRSRRGERTFRRARPVPPAKKFLCVSDIGIGIWELEIATERGERKKVRVLLGTISQRQTDPCRSSTINEKRSLFRLRTKRFMALKVRQDDIDSHCDIISDVAHSWWRRALPPHPGSNRRGVADRTSLALGIQAHSKKPGFVVIESGGRLESR
jgi:hypothetical protein